MSRRGFPEGLGRLTGGLPSPWGVLRGCAERSPGAEESAGAVARKRPGGIY